MKVYTQEDFDKFEKDKHGYIICQSGHYAAIKSFPAFCRFGERCSFGECCSFGEHCSFGEYCSFGECCSFGEGCLYCLFQFNKLINLNGVYAFPIRIYLNTKAKEYYLSIGCENFATLDECRTMSKERSEDNDNIINIVDAIIKEALK